MRGNVLRLHSPAIYLRSHPRSNRELRQEEHRRRRPREPEPQPLLFYNRDEPYYEFTNFSHHPIEFRGRVYPTSEHLFQAHKFLDYHPDIAERIRCMPSPSAALREATRLNRLRRADWYDVNVGIMDMVLEAKFTQHPSLQRLLLETGDRPLFENSPVDSFWGIGEDANGRNELGKALMRLREKLQRMPH
ncbi:hypothetical protein BKA93DRAFT_742118 [Sparassis latifolia]